MPPPSRLSYPPDNASLFPSSPTASRGTRASSVFPYSLARPPTNYSEASWLPKPSARPKPTHPPPQYQSIKEDDEEGDGETPLYARSDWEDETPKADRHVGHRQLVASPSSFRHSRSSGGSLGAPTQRGNEPTQVERDGEPSGTAAWSRSSHGGEMTSRFTHGPGTLGGIAEEDEESPVYPNYTGAGVVASPDAMTPLPATPWTAATMERRSPHSPHSPRAIPLQRQSQSPFVSPVRPRHSRSRSASSLPKVIATHMMAKKRQSSQFQGHLSFDSEFARKQMERQSTLPSILDLEYLTGGAHSPDPFADPLTHRQVFRNMTPSHSAFPAPPPIPEDERDPGDGHLMTPGAQQRLGRMSIAPARYSLHPKKKAKSRSSHGSGSDQKSSLRNSLNVGSRIKSWQTNTVVRFYLTWRPFIVAGLALMSALLLTITLQNTPSRVQSVVKVQPRVFNVSASEPQPVGLGVSGWCQLAGDDPECREFKSGDFANGDRTFKLPGDSLLPAIGELFTALTATTWLLAMYAVVTAFFHFYLFFALSIPFSHLVDESAPLPRDKPRGLDEKAEFEADRFGKDPVQVEVDIRVKCERPPYEGYVWVWWAWWGHRRSPVGVIFSLVQGVMALSSFAASISFYNKVVAATSEERVKLGGAAIVPFLVLVFTLDHFIFSARWLFNASRSWLTFLHPPEPSAAAIMLPAPRKMEHLRPTTERSSFFAARTTFPPTTAYGALGNSAVPPMPGQELDEETRRWLVAYPSDPELVPLIAALRQGEENEDFLLSEVGLVYLRPETEDEAALLVPPAGKIRRELIEDAHIPPPDEGTNPDEVEHRPIDEILAELNETFWWTTLEQDVVEYVKTCEECARRRIELKPGMTAVDYTGVTGWTAGGETTAVGGVGESAMAAEMAFAMRKAEEEARVVAL